MATIHVLKPAPATKPIDAAMPARSAEIIFFPGVRYERWSSPPAPAAKAPRKRRSRVKRDRMTIVV